ncbi:putative acetyl-CoA synthetase [Clavulina sp. PMI_390]|nr:putative acetyl-CoA synthetase [Clavulina sp. PMI_390]
MGACVDIVYTDKTETKTTSPHGIPGDAAIPNGVSSPPPATTVQRRRFPVGARLANPATPELTPHVGPDLAAYRAAYNPTIGDKTSDAWWAQIAREHVHWYRDFGTTVTAGGFEKGDIVWFPDGQLNVSYNCVDRWAQQDPERVAIIYEADEPGDSYTITYGTLLAEVSQLANVLKNSLGVKRGDVVTIYLPVHWRAAVALLACARIGAIHSVVFAGFSADALRERIRDARSRVVITADEGRRGGKVMPLKAIVDKALSEAPSSSVNVEHVLVLRRVDSEAVKTNNWTEGRDVWWDEEAAKQSTECEPEVMNAEDPLFILYTSGSTGKPKGVVHTTGGYLVQTASSVKYIFDLHPGDRFACVADVGWITGHTFVVYGPLANGVATTIFESTPTYPTPSRYWDAVDRWSITQFYCAPTAIRQLRRQGPSYVSPRTHSLASLRVIGSGGEPTNPEAWHWYNTHVGRAGQCAVLDTWWTTETGAIMIAPFPGAIETKPGTSGVPFFGIVPAVLHSENGQKLEWESEEGLLVIEKPWPAIARTIWGNHERYLETYMRPRPGYFYTGDGATIDQNGYFSIKGRVDDVINVSGRRLSTSEIESALIRHPLISEAAVIGADDDLTGQAVHAFVTCTSNIDPTNTSELEKELKLCVRQAIGGFAAPKKYYFVSNLPTTRSGKLMRRVMRKIVAGEGDRLGDLSTVADPSAVSEIKAAVANANANRPDASRSPSMDSVVA